MNKIRVFLKDVLSLELSEEKTKITNAKSEHAEFLSVRIKKSNHETYAVRRGVVSRNVKNMRLTAPIDKVTKKLTKNGFMAGDRPYPKFV